LSEPEPASAPPGPGGPGSLVPAARATALRRRLLAWWGAGHRALPWRFPPGAADPYRVWLSEVMLQQTRVEAVLPYYRRFLAKWPTLRALAAAPDGEVLAAWSGLGYYARCRNLLRAARAALREHGGLPASLEALRALPGTGPYTAGAVASIAFGIPAAAVDGNAARVLARLFRLAGDPARGPFRRRAWALARQLAGEGTAGRPSPGAPGEWTQALMELGATVCRRTPECRRCPLATLCEARRGGVERRLPRPGRRPARRPMVLACALIRRRGELLLARQPEGALFAGLLGLPSAEVHPGEEPAAALRRALRARGLAVRTARALGSARRTLTHRDLELHALSCTLLRAPPRPGGEGAGLSWVAMDRAEEAGLPSAMRALLRAVRASAPA